MCNSEVLMFYNVENLLIPVSSNQHFQKNNFGVRRWNTKRYQSKLFKITQVIDLIKQEEGILPMLIGFAEIQGRKPIEDLLKLDPLNKNYNFVHYESMDERGMDVALVYDETKLELLHSEPISYFFEVEDHNTEYFDTTRDALHCKMKYESKIINVFVLHLPSKREKDINKPKRNYILKNIKEIIETIKTDTEESVIIIGDFNENPNEDNMQMLTDFSDQFLYNPFIEQYNEKQFSTFHHGDGLLFDQILISKDFLTKTSKLTFSKARVFIHKKITNWDKKFRGRPFRTFSGSRYMGGYSDHFPVLAKFNIIKNIFE